MPAEHHLAQVHQAAPERALLERADIQEAIAPRSSGGDVQPPRIPRQVDHEHPPPFATAPSAAGPIPPIRIVYAEQGVIVITDRVEDWFGVREMMDVPLPLAVQPADDVGIESAARHQRE